MSTTATGMMTTITTTTTAAITTKTIMAMTVGRGVAVVVLKTEPAAVAEMVEAMAVSTARADNNQQRAAKMAAAVMAVGERRQARGEKRQGQRGGRGGGSGSGNGGGSDG